jgi:hypothetical protein
MKPLPERFRGCADFSNSEHGRDMLRIAEIMGEISRRAVDPDGRNEPIAARLAARWKAATAVPGEAEDLLHLTGQGVLPEGFLATFQRLAARPSESSRQCSYLASLLDFRLKENRWPFAAQADRHAAGLFPESFAGCGNPATDGKVVFKRLRNSLGLDWLPKAKGGRPRK